MRRRLKNHFVPHQGNDFKPHFVREKSLAIFALCVTVLFGLAFSLRVIITKYPDALSAVITSVLVDRTNSNRLENNLAALDFSPVLAAAAQLKADDMAQNGYFAHVSPDGKTPWHWFSESGYGFVYAGENLAVNFADSEDVVRAWMNSEGHRANILNDRFTEIGIAIASGKHNGRDSIFVVQMFGRPAPQGASTRPSPSDESVPSSATMAEEPRVSGAVAVAGEHEVFYESDMFVAVQNSDHADFGEIDTKPVLRASFVEKLALSPRVVLKAIYIFAGLVVLFVTVLFVIKKPSDRHTKHVAYALVLLALIAALFYLTSAHLFPQVIVE